MEDATKLIESFSALLWPLIVIGFIIIFRPAIIGLIESAKSRKFTLKVGGQELTMEEASERQRTLITDLQSQVVELQKSTGQPSRQSIVADDPFISELVHPTILWVDDYPKNNSYFVELLAERGISTDLALSTEEGLAKFKSGQYISVISDMGRREDGKEKPEAGLDLLTQVRDVDSQMPFFIFCSGDGVRRAGAKAKQLGVSGITSSNVGLLRLLELDQVPVRR